MYIYIVGFCPASNEDGSQTSGVGGFDWYYNAKGLRERMRKHLEQDIDLDSDYVVRRLRVPAGIDNAEAIDAWLNAVPNLFNTHEQEND